jgi:hypothetical protein
MAQVNYDTMSGQELVDAYNAQMVKTGGRQIKEFRSRADGIKRLSQLNGSSDLPEDPAEAKRQLDAELGGNPSDTGKPPQGSEVQGVDGVTAHSKVRRKRAPREAIQVDTSSKKSIEAGMGLREGTHKANAARRLIASLGKMIPADQLVQSTYGEDGGSVGSLQMVLKGIDAAIASRGLPLELKRERDADKKLCFGLFVR